MEDLANKDSSLVDKKIVVALSGGVDSVVLLHFLNSTIPVTLELFILTIIYPNTAKSGALFVKIYVKKTISNLKVLILLLKTPLISKKMHVKNAIFH